MPRTIIIVTAADLAAANANLQAAGLGPDNVSIRLSRDAQGAVAGTATPSDYAAAFASLTTDEANEVAAQFSSAEAVAAGRRLTFIEDARDPIEFLADIGLYRIQPPMPGT